MSEKKEKPEGEYISIHPDGTFLDAGKIDCSSKQSMIEGLKNGLRRSALAAAFHVAHKKTKGPGQVANEAYRRNYDQIFNSKKSERN